MSDRSSRSDRLRKRIDRAPGVGDDSGADDPATGEADSAEMGSGSVKDRPSVLMYLPEEVRAELDVRFDELNARHKREHGEPLEKNRDYYPAVIRAGLEGTSVEDVLGI